MVWSPDSRCGIDFLVWLSCDSMSNTHSVVMDPIYTYPIYWSNIYWFSNNGRALTSQKFPQNTIRCNVSAALAKSERSSKYEGSEKFRSRIIRMNGAIQDTWASNDRLSEINPRERHQWNIYNYLNQLCVPWLTLRSHPVIIKRHTQ